VDVRDDDDDDNDDDGDDDNDDDGDDDNDDDGDDVDKGVIEAIFSKLPESPANAIKYTGGSFASAPLISKEFN
jgi:hypothetical protein